MIETRAATPTPPATLFETNPLPPYPLLTAAAELVVDAGCDVPDAPDDEDPEDPVVEGVFPVAAA
jgi:hypothetical protein